MKIVLVFDQGLAGAGGKSNPNVGLNAAKGGIGSALMMESHFKEIGAEVVATLYCGNEYFLNNQEEVVTKMTAMCKKLNPDFVVCGPCFNFPDYAKMAAMISANILSKTTVKSCAMMSKENAGVIEEYKDKTPIVIMPKKGGTGLNDSYSALCKLIYNTVNNTADLEKVKAEVCY
ncbi:MAG: glycine/betaine/sarcosine/D-proline family reductase selenoprotein B [Erysipelotrichaceae bacterium]|nr:glycine/betaine/sarcosine/D-proline family reductase selenoprotein B [Erysipelotrichaceae bacterium]MDY5252722.1 GrdB-related putative oxidoreductase [Erysipelotrichaceae bacterium]